MDDKSTYKYRAELRMAALGIKTSDIAEAAGMTPGGYRQVLDGDNPTIGSLARIEDALGVPRGWLIGSADNAAIAVDTVTMAPPDWLVTKRAQPAESVPT
jgi:transcriptional regulator with XRE-family HTH domain